MTKLNTFYSADASHYCVVSAGDCMYQCHRIDVPGVDFNSGAKRAGRFTPLVSTTGEVVPTLYTAKTFSASIYEALFRKEPTPTSNVSIDQVTAVCMSQILVYRDLPMVPLFTPELRRWNIDENALFSHRADSYLAFRVLATRIWRKYQSACGIAWRSRQDCASIAFLFFGDRCSKDDFVVQQTYSANSDAEFLAEVTDVALQAGVKVIL